MSSEADDNVQSGSALDVLQEEELSKVSCVQTSVVQSKVQVQKENKALLENFNELDAKDNSEPVPVYLSSDELVNISKEDLITKWNEQRKYISFIESQLEFKQREGTVRESEERLKAQLLEVQKREQYHIMRLSSKEQEIQELRAQLQELKTMACSGSGFKHALLDPAANLLFDKLKRDFDVTKAKMEETQNELSAWKFTPDSNTGKQLMARCRLLLKENEEHGKMISSGRLAKLEGELALQRSHNEDLKKTQAAVDDILTEADEDAEAMEGTIWVLQGRLRELKDTAILGSSNTPEGPSGAQEILQEGPIHPACEYPEQEHKYQKKEYEHHSLKEKLSQSINLKRETLIESQDEHPKVGQVQEGCPGELERDLNDHGPFGEGDLSRTSPSERHESSVEVAKQEDTNAGVVDASHVVKGLNGEKDMPGCEDASEGSQCSDLRTTFGRQKRTLSEELSEEQGEHGQDCSPPSKRTCWSREETRDDNDVLENGLE